MDAGRLSVVLFIMFFLSCSGDKDQYSNPEELIIGLAVSEDYDKTAGRISSLQAYLSEMLDRNVRVFKLTNGSAIIEAMKAKKVHMGSVGAFSYIMAKSKADISPIVTTAAVSEDRSHNYWSSLIVANSSTINNFDDLRKEKSNLSLAWSYPTSTSGHLVPRSFMLKNGVLPEDFREVMVSENHVASIYNCIAGKVDVAAVNSIVLKEYLRRGKISDNDYKVIWNSTSIPRGAIFVSNDLDKDLILKIREAFVNLHKKDLKSARRIHYRYDYDVKYIPINDTHYDSLRAMAQMVGLLD